jgi:hypothetical protein
MIETVVDRRGVPATPMALSLALNLLARNYFKSFFFKSNCCQKMVGIRCQETF